MTRPAPAAPTTLRATLKAMAGYEALKGVAAVAALLGLLSLLHRDLHQLALELIGRLHLKPTAHASEWLLQAADRLDTQDMRVVGAVIISYALLRWIEAWGLWHDKAWGEWLGALFSGLYIPLEVQHLLAHRHWQGALVLLLNIVVVAVLLRRLQLRRKA